MFSTFFLFFIYFSFFSLFGSYLLKLRALTKKSEHNYVVGMKPKPQEIVAARALLRWTAADLLQAANHRLSKSTLEKIEAGKPVRPLLLDTVIQTLEAEGIVFLENGVCLKQKEP